MADFPDLTSKTLNIIQHAQDQLISRAGRTMNAVELDRIMDLRNTLDESAVIISSADLTRVAEDNPIYLDLSEQLDATNIQILGLHETSDFDNLYSVCGKLRHQAIQLVALAGPHGPGGGNPIGGWSGGGNPIGKKKKL
jgi:hypothetical protein